MEIVFIVFVIIVIFIGVISNISKLEFPTTDVVIKRKGKEGENIVNYYLQEIKDEGKILNNLYIPTVYGNTTEIDTLFLTTDAIFVIESKNINGTIEGNVEDERWMSIRDDRNRDFRNPIKQNATHVKYLKKQLNHLIPIYSIIAFDDEADLDNIDIDNNHIDIIHYSELVDVINDKLKDDCHFLRTGEYNSLCIKLEKFVNVSDEVKQKHDNYIKENYG